MEPSQKLQSWGVAVKNSIVANIRWGTQQRLKHLEQEIYWKGRINRQILAEQTGVSVSQASKDIAAYKALAKNNLIYDLTEKTYKTAPRFTPVFIETSPHKFIETLPEAQAETLCWPYRDIDQNCLRHIHLALQKEEWVKIEYQAMTSANVTIRMIAPHTFLYEGMRWHVRAFDFSSGSFRDFVLGRIQSAARNCSENELTDVSLLNHKWQKAHDESWHTMVNLILGPHPQLTDSQRQAIEADYGMVDGQVTFKVRKASLIYVVSRMRLLDESNNPSIQQVVLMNRSDIERALS